MRRSEGVVPAPLLAFRGGRRGGRVRRNGADGWWALALIGPMLAGLAVFYLWPIAKTLYLSFTETGIFGGSRFIGFGNYETVMTSSEIHRGLLNTLVFSGITLASIPIALILATLMNQKGLRGKGVYRVIYFLPVVTMPVAVGLVWRQLLNGDYGLLNGALASVGIAGPSWLVNSSTALLAVSAVGVWSVVGYNVVLFLAGLQSIPAYLYEAAELDGASALSRFRHVTVPMISPTLFFVSVISIINSLQMFDLIYIMIGARSPVIPDTETVIYLFYRIGFIENNKGLASALAFCLLLIVMVLTGIQFRMQKRWVTYD